MGCFELGVVRIPHSAGNFAGNETFSFYSTKDQWFFFCSQVCFQGLFWRNGDIDAKIFPHIRFRLPSPHLYLAPVSTFPSGYSTVVRDYWQASSCSPALFFFSGTRFFSFLHPDVYFFPSPCKYTTVDLVNSFTGFEKFGFMCKMWFGLRDMFAFNGLVHRLFQTNYLRHLPNETYFFATVKLPI